MEHFFNQKTDSIINRIVLLFCLLVLIFAIYNSFSYEDSIHNPENQEFVNETAFNLGIDPSKITQKQFNNRYKN